jgi:spore coat protein U-like protein
LVTAYDATGGTNEGSGVDANYRQIASGSGTAQNAVLTLAAAATISPITPAASDYSDTIQVIGAGNF